MKLSSLQKRFVIAIPLSILAGIICVAVANSSTPGIWGTALMWTIITNRIIIGMIVGLAGAYTRHPVFGFPIPSYFRGFCLGVFVSVSLAAGSMMTPDAPWMIFWATLVAGGVYGSVIDILATKFGGEGKDLVG